MTDNEWDIIIEQGATFKPQLTMQDSSGAPINLTGYTARMQVRASFSSVTPIVDITQNLSSQGQLVLGGVLGTIDIRILASHTTTLVPGVYLYDLELVEPSGDVDRILQGTAVVEAEVTR